MTTTTVVAGTVVAAGLALLMSGCSDEPRRADGLSSTSASTRLGPAKGDLRLLALPEQVTRTKRAYFIVPAGTKRLLLRAKCEGGEKASTFRVRVSTAAGGNDYGVGGGGFDCSHGFGSVVGLEDGGSQFIPGQTNVVITAPPGATWSLDVDADSNGHG